MEYLKIILTSLISVAAMFIITRVIGYRQMSEMCMFDYVNGITIGSIGAELATIKLGDFEKPLVAMVVFGTASVFLSWVTSKSRRLRGLLNGTPIILMKDGKMYRDNFVKSRIDLDEFLMQCRGAGYFELSQIGCAILEVNGNLSILPRAEDKPCTPKDMKLTVTEATPPVSVILDGKVDKKSLAGVGFEEKWLEKQVKKMGFSSVGEVFYASVSDGVLYVYGGK